MSAGRALTLRLASQRRVSLETQPFSSRDAPANTLPQHLNPCMPLALKPHLLPRPELTPKGPPSSWTLPPPSTPESHAQHLPLSTPDPRIRDQTRSAHQPALIECLLQPQVQVLSSLENSASMTPPPTHPLLHPPGALSACPYSPQTLPQGAPVGSWDQAQPLSTAFRALQGLPAFLPAPTPLSLVWRTSRQIWIKCHFL